MQPNRTPRTQTLANEQPPTPQATRPGISRPLRLGAWVLLAVYLLILAWLSLRPLPVSWTSPANLTLFASVRQALRLGGLAGVRQLADGLVPLAPFGVLLPLACGELPSAWLPSLLRTAGGAALLATGREILEGWAPGHVSNVDNILLGTLGATLCHLAVIPALRALRRRARRPEPTVEPGEPDASAPHEGPTPVPV